MESREARWDDDELKVDGRSGIPPLGFEGRGIRTSGKIDTLPDMDTGVSSTGGIEVYVGVVCIETRGVPGDVDRSCVHNRLRRIRGLVKPASGAS